MLTHPVLRCLFSQLLNVIVLKAFAGFDRIPMRAKHLDKLETKVCARLFFDLPSSRSA
jgi:hypothetical protein